VKKNHDGSRGNFQGALDREREAQGKLAEGVSKRVTEVEGRLDQMGEAFRVVKEQSAEHTGQLDRATANITALDKQVKFQLGRRNDAIDKLGPKLEATERELENTKALVNGLETMVVENGDNSAGWVTRHERWLADHENRFKTIADIFNFHQAQIDWIVENFNKTMNVQVPQVWLQRPPVALPRGPFIPPQAPTLPQNQRLRSGVKRGGAPLR